MLIHERLTDRTAGGRVLRWYLDRPGTSGRDFSPGKPLRIRGWVLGHDGDEVQVAIASPSGEHRHSLSVPRRDVVRVVLGETADGNPRLVCGFDFSIEDWEHGLTLGIAVNEHEVHWCLGMRPAPPTQVEEGEAGWLFLKNDTNQSVEQYTGKRLLSPSTLADWDVYFSSLERTATRINSNWRFLLSPAKEYIFPDYYPHVQGAQTPLKQFLDRFGKRDNVICPLAELSTTRELSYWKGDTHWTDYGAWLASRAVLLSLGICHLEMERAMRFVVRERSGDLGTKLSPPKKFHVYKADGMSAATGRTYDNGVMNRGRVWIYSNPAASHGGTCILFGGSSSLNMVFWLAAFFNRLVFVHTAGDIDLDIVEHEVPDLILAQTNSRFVIKAATHGRFFKDILASKLKHAPPLSESLPMLKDGPQSSATSLPDRFYTQMMVEAYRRVAN